ncbi:hypothetical protein TWF481_006254 [Arthrobotrys musiformis]|uniref:Uncharacterized protein n=1 Tax=Arthrobotrys musiformis TaxID=47236 RepID=A0AAV9WGB8_9PEZI
MNAARLIHPRLIRPSPLLSRPLLSRPSLVRHLPSRSLTDICRPVTNPPSLPIDSNIDQKLDFIVAKLTEINKAVAGLNKVTPLQDEQIQVHTSSY